MSVGASLRIEIDLRVTARAQAPALDRLRRLAPARPPRPRPRRLGRARPSPRAADRGDLRAARRAEREGHVLRPRHDRRALSRSRACNRRQGPRARLPWVRPQTRPDADPRRVPCGCRALRGARSRSSAASGRSATARRPSRSRAKPRGPTTSWPSSASATTPASTTRRASATASEASPVPRTGSSSATGARSGSTRSPSGPSAAARSRWAEAPTGARCRRPSFAAPYARWPPRTRTLCCTSIRTSSTRSRCGRRCPRARLRSSARWQPGRASSAIPAGGWSRIGFVRSPRTTR